ncbi:MAG TPA: RluA family pseudouridine synthase [Planctomycetes bacterium]|nr:RluA family pseudouridine synthase [Planctomycetota bacterium]
MEGRNRDLSLPLKRFVFRVEDEEDGLRLDHALMDRIHWRSRSDLQARIRRGGVLVNEQPAKASRRLQTGDEIAVLIRPEDLPDQDPARVPLSVLHEDEDVIVLNKAPGVLVHPIGRHVLDTLVNALWLRFKKSGETGRGVEPHVVQRLDRNTSGVLILAKTRAAKIALQDVFENRLAQKTYLAWVEGRPDVDAGSIRAPLARDQEGEIRIRMKVDPAGAPSHTEFEVLERHPDASLVRFHLHTGRQHQIRVHAAHLGHPLLADPLYGDPRDVGVEGDAEPRLGRQALHAERLVLPHPSGRGDLDIRAPLPNDLSSLGEGLREGLGLKRFEDRQSGTWVIRRRH